MNDDRKELMGTFLWFVEEYSCYWQKLGAPLYSPDFTFDGLEGIMLHLEIRQKDRIAENNGSIFLLFCRNDAGSENLKVSLELAVLAENGSAVHAENFEALLGREGSGRYLPLARTVDIHLSQKDGYLPNDTLSIRCVMWKGEGDVQKTKQIVVRTRVFTQQTSFVHIVKDFSKLRENVKQTKEFQSSLGSTFTSTVYLVKGPGCEEKIIIEIIPLNAYQKIHDCKLYLRSRYSFIECGSINNCYNAEVERKQNLSFTLTKQAILNRKNEYLRDDELLILCECTYSAGLQLNKAEETPHELPCHAIKQKTVHDHNKDVLETTKIQLRCPSALDDMKTLYMSQLLTDMELRTKTKSFPAHKAILCARSPVFAAMMTTDMKEKNTASIRVDDLENDTVEQLLLFLYSDSLENLQWKSAVQLYYAADKYEIGKLKATCSSFLVENLNASNAGELLLLADTHSDCNLRKIVEEYIMKNEEQVFGSDEWEKMIETNPLLVIKTMHLKYKRKN